MSARLTRRYRVTVLTSSKFDFYDQQHCSDRYGCRCGQITDVINDAFRIAEKFFIDAERITEQEVRESLVKGDFLLAETDGKLNGCVYVEMRGTRSYLGLLSVDPACQQSGLGSMLMEEAEDYCRACGSRFMDILIVHLRDDLPPFY